MAWVELTRHLHRFFPHLPVSGLQVDGTTVAEIVAGLEAIAPGFAFYVCDERGALRTHVNIFVEQERVRDRARLTDPVAPTATVHILQALSGG
jgi:hypothetical protein